jgi:hypothetical protein
MVVESEDSIRFLKDQFLTEVDQYTARKMGVMMNQKLFLENSK